jgi:predicted Zn-dependent protease
VEEQELQVRFGLVNIVADKTTPASLGLVAYDDEGVPPSAGT